MKLNVLKERVMKGFFKVIERNVDWLIKLSGLLNSIDLGVFTRILPLVDCGSMILVGLNESQLRKSSFLRVFVMFSLGHNYQKMSQDVAVIFSINDACGLCVA